MKTYRKLSVVLLLFTACIHDFQNPSDPQDKDYSTHSNAVMRILSGGTIAAGDTVHIFGGVSSKTVEKAGLVVEYLWDFNGDGTTDTILNRSDTLGIVYKDTGVYHCTIMLTDGAGYRDSASATVHVRAAVRSVDTIRVAVNRSDTVTVVIINKNPATVISKSGDTITVIPHAGDSIAVLKNKHDTVVVKQSGSTPISIIPPDTITQPPPEVYLPDFPNIPGFPNIIKEDCPFYVADSSLMHTTLNFYDIMWEQTRSDGLQAIDFAEKLVADIMGYGVITLIQGNYSYTFSAGVYQFKSSEGFTLTCAFHYGAGASGHAEDDTVKANLFQLESYISGLKTSFTPPYFSYTKGPLFDLIDGTPTIDQSLKVSFSVNFSKLKISFVRSTVHASVPLPVYVLNDSVRLPVTLLSYARMKPTPMQGFRDLFYKDSIIIDHSGTTMSSSPVPLAVKYRSGSTYRKTEYAFTIQQKMDMQKTAYGDRNGTLKLSGEYAAQASLGFDNLSDSTFFKGRYSSSAPDSSYFFCDPQMANEFGTLFFGITPPADVGTFASEKYGYSFPYTPMRVSLDSYVKR